MLDFLLFLTNDELIRFNSVVTRKEGMTANHPFFFFVFITF